MAPRLSGQTSIFGVVFFVSKSLLGIEGQKKLEKFAILTRKPRSHARILMYIERGLFGITWMSNIKDVPMVIVLFSYFPRYWTWWTRTMYGRTNERTHGRTYGQ